MAEYVSNARLRDVINLYNDMNVNDQGEWCAGYLQRLENKKAMGKITEEKFILGKDFITNKVKHINELQEKYGKMTPEEKRKYNIELEKVKNEMCDYILLIINGRINSFKLRSTLFDVSEIDDIIQDAAICVLQYINRYDGARGTSAFAFVTQLVTNSIILSLSQINERAQKMVNGLEYFDNINTIDDPMDSTSGMARFLE